MNTFAKSLSTTLLALAVLACEPDPEQVAVSTVLDETVQALERGDMTALWTLSAPKAREEILALHARVHEALAAADGLYEGEDRERARAALGAQLFAGVATDDPDAGPRLLDALLDEKAMRLDDEARDGLRTRGAVIDGDTAVIHTSAGEQFTFQRTEEGWRSRLVMDLFEQNPRIAALRQNADGVLAAADEHRKAWIASKDPRTPQGAYNLLRAAAHASPRDAGVLYTLLDAPAHAVLVEALQASREAQKVLQRKTARRQREATYAEHGLALYVTAASDRALYEAWARSDAFASPVSVDSPPDRVEGDEASGAVKVIPTDGPPLSFVRDADGHWRLAGHAATLGTALLEPVKATLAKLTPTP